MASPIVKVQASYLRVRVVPYSCPVAMSTFPLYYRSYVAYVLFQMPKFNGVFGVSCLTVFLLFPCSDPKECVFSEHSQHCREASGS